MYSIDTSNMLRYKEKYVISDKKVTQAAEKALEYLEKSLDRFTDKFPITAGGFCVDFPKGATLNRYFARDTVTWTTSMWTGIYWMAYELTGNSKFRVAAENHVNMCADVAMKGIGLDDHDTGFKFSPSCVAAYRITGDEKAKEAALTAAEILFEHYCQKNNFIIRSGMRRPEDKYENYRMLVDSMMNIPLFFWAYEETKDKKYIEAAIGHYRSTEKYLVRNDGSSYHHYQFDPVTLNPVGGLTFQGNGDESTWSRGHSWLVYGFPMAYKYTKDESIFDVHKAVSYYFLNNLPSDYIPYWDFDFKEGSFEPRDSSALAISVCGIMEMCKYLPDSAEEKQLYENASNILLEALIDKCSNSDKATDGLIRHVTLSKPHCMGVDTIATYGDYFYFEALMRILKPDWKICW